MTKSSERPKVGLAKSKAKAVVPGSAVKVPAAIDEAALLGDLRTLVQSARQRIATAAYSTQTLLCWHMGGAWPVSTCKAAEPPMANRFL